MKKKFLLAAVAVALGAGVSFQASAQAKPEQLVKQRQSAMALIGWYFGPIGAMMRGDRPFDAAVVARNAGYLEVLSKMPAEGFQPSTKDEKATKAKPEVWADKAKFDKAMENMQGEVAKLAQVAKGGDQGAIKTQFGATGKACAACHDDFRAK
jgi:cytochrome c556